MQPRDVGGS